MDQNQNSHNKNLEVFRSLIRTLPETTALLLVKAIEFIKTNEVARAEWTAGVEDRSLVSEDALAAFCKKWGV